jgi:hypothetical protein
MGAVSHLYPERQAPDFWSRASETEAGRLDEGFIQPSQPGSALACMRQAEGSAADEGWAAADLDQASVPLAASLIALFIERYPGLPTPAIKALMAKAAEEGAFDGLIESDGMASVGMTFAADAMTDLAMSAVNDHVASEPDAVRLNAAG